MTRPRAIMAPVSARETDQGTGSHPGAVLHGAAPATSRHLQPKRRRRARTLLQILTALLLAASIALPALAIDPLPFQSTAQRERFQNLTSELRCMVCQDESLLASNADFAKQMRRQIFEMMQEGKSDQEIKDWLVARYSTFILYDPPLAPSTIALWFGTPAILLVGGIVVFVVLRRRVHPAHAITRDPGDDW